MKTRWVRVEQREANTREVEGTVNKELKKLEAQGHTITNIKLAVGRDADITSGLKKRYSVTAILMYEPQKKNDNKAYKPLIVPTGHGSVNVWGDTFSSTTFMITLRGLASPSRILP